VPVASGKKRHRVTIYAPEGTSNEFSGSPTEIATGIAASIEPLPLQFQQQERIAAGGQRGQVVYNVAIEYRDDLQANFEIHEECCMERTFHIVTMIPDDKLREWLLTCHVVL
jgi:head-tail adaptor